MTTVLVVFRDDCEWRELVAVLPDTPEGLEQAKATVVQPPGDLGVYEWCVHRYPVGVAGEFDDRDTQVWPEPGPPPTVTAGGHVPFVSLASVGGPAVRRVP